MNALFLPQSPLPDTVTAIAKIFLGRCEQLQVIDLQNTALQRVGGNFARNSPHVTTVALPDTVTDIDTALIQHSDSDDTLSELIWWSE